MTDESEREIRQDFIREKVAAYEALDAWDSTVEGHFLVRCPGCEQFMHLGEGWRGLSVPECPDCMSGDEWTADADPCISVDVAEELAAENRNIRGVIGL